MIINIGALCFGVVVGWVTSRTLRRSTSSGLSDIATVIGAVGGAAITGIYKPSADAFGYYAIGLAAGFFAYLIIAIGIAKKEGTLVGDWLGSDPPPALSSSGANPPPPPPENESGGV